MLQEYLLIDLNGILPGAGADIYIIIYKAANSCNISRKKIKFSILTCLIY